MNQFMIDLTARSSALYITHPHLQAFLSMQHVNSVAPHVPPQIQDVFLKFRAQPLHGRPQASNGVGCGAVEDQAGAASLRMLKQQQHGLVKVLL